MRKRGDGFRFALEPNQPVRALRERRRKHLNRHLAFEATVLRFVDLAHPASTEGREDLVRAEP